MSDIDVSVRRSTLSDVSVAVRRSRRNQEEAAFVGVGSYRIVVMSETKKGFNPRFKLNPLFKMNLMFKLNPLVEINLVFKLSSTMLNWLVFIVKNSSIFQMIQPLF